MLRPPGTKKRIFIMSAPTPGSPGSAELALRESEEKFRAVFDKSPIPVALTTVPEGILTAINPAARAAFGLEPGEGEGRTTTELNMWVDPAVRQRYLEVLRTQGTVTGYEARMRRKDGGIMTMLYNGSIVQIGGQSYVVSSLLDITERTRAESKFHDLFEFAPDAMLIAQPNGAITDVNRRAVELFGFSREEMIGQSPAMLIPPDAQPALMERIKNYLANPVPRPMGASGSGLTACSKTGRVFPIDISLSPLRSETGELVVAAVREITDQLRASAEQEALGAQLRQAQKMDALGTLAGGIAHDFNNLLTAILGHAELAALDVRPPHPVAEHLAAIREAGLRSRELVRQILTFSRRTDSARAPMRLQTVVEDAVRMLRSTIPAMVRIERQTEPGCPAVLGDATQIHQVLMNLCTNAWHALPEHGGRIEIRLQACVLDAAADGAGMRLKPGPHARLSVSDNGHGMDAATLERIYDPFFTTKAVGKGTGLGLSMVHGIVKSHDGAIFVRSQPGVGTTFDLYFPAIPSAVAPAPAGAAEISRGRGERILYIDDDELVARTVTQLLTHLGYRVVHRALPSTALELFRTAPQNFDLVLTDLAMPEMPGTQLADEVARVRPELPVLLITGYLDRGQDETVRRTGVREVLRKPLSPEELGAALRRALG